MKNITDLLLEFRRYLEIRRDRAESTAYSYGRDANDYIVFFKEGNDDKTNLIISGELLVGYLYYLKKQSICNATIKRRLIGVRNFWKFLYKKGYVEEPPVTLDDLDIVVKKKRNPTQPLGPQDYVVIREEIKNELSYIY
ncbi:MAG: site-specific integrase [Acidobacteriota bacterium]|nr:site-specific integrase [Acidobacteriota bacterium]